MNEKNYVFYNNKSHSYIKQMDRRLVSGDVDYCETDDPDKALSVLTDMDQATSIAKRAAVELELPEKTIIVKEASKGAIEYTRNRKLLADLHEAVISCVFQGDKMAKRAVNQTINDFINYAGIELEEADDWEDE
ncbi:hypothetical protein [Lentilactobacillus parabuchneri]|uniref:hypothetical protein n=1 Tax=Lentilactobacillus parabuchneri TaxID=152331 RepID=UPI002307C22F|nr:hypothetical protein [Lentilactobacillus parabuchneri]MDB1104857.1 hypothetical protein [Lentilactobacillus parabuchneri]